MKVIEQVFGQRSSEYTMILFTCGDQLRGKPFEELLKKCTQLKELVDNCGGGYHVFDNETQDCTQVSKLLKKINLMVLENGESYYTNGKCSEKHREKNGQSGQS